MKAETNKTIEVKTLAYFPSNFAIKAKRLERNKTIKITTINDISKLKWSSNLKAISDQMKLKNKYRKLPRYFTNKL